MNLGRVRSISRYLKGGLIEDQIGGRYLFAFEDIEGWQEGMKLSQLKNFGRLGFRPGSTVLFEQSPHPLRVCQIAPARKAPKSEVV
jgi:hypothetical protein